MLKVLEPKEGDANSTVILKATLEIIVYSNPMYHFVTYFREITYGCVEAGNSVWTTFPTLGILYLFGILFAGIGTLVFALARKNFIYYI